MSIQALLADDDPAILRTLAGILRLDQVEVTTATSGREAVEELKRRDFDLVITDMRMETQTAGLEVIRAAALHRCRPEIIVLTAFPLSQTDVETSGACTIMMKASDPHIFVRRLHSIVNLIKAQHGSRRP